MLLRDLIREYTQSRTELPPAPPARPVPQTHVCPKCKMESGRTAVEQGAQQPVLKVDGQGVQQVQGLVPVHNLGADQSPEQFRRQGCGQPGLLLGRAGLRSRGGSQRRVSGGSARRRSGSGHCQGQAAQDAKKKG